MTLSYLRPFLVQKKKLKTTITIGIAQISPVWLDKQATTKKMCSYIRDAASRGCDLVVFGEALLPGYPFWIELTDGAVFESSLQKELFALYARQAVSVEEGELDEFCLLAKEYRIMIVVGFIERAGDRGGHSLYCSLAIIDTEGQSCHIHRKVMPTYEERLVWGTGDGHGLRVNPLEAFTVGALNCWENWMPLLRSALYAQGEDLHIALWPGSVRNTEDITRFIARESRSFVVSVSGLLNVAEIPPAIPGYSIIREKCCNWPADGGSCIAGPDGSWIIAPTSEREVLLVGQIDYDMVLRERQNFDPSGHYSRPDIVQLHVNRERQKIARFSDNS